MGNQTGISQTNQDAEYRRYFQLLNLFVAEGAIFLMHPQLLQFSEGDRKHFAVSKNNLIWGYTYSIFNPCTSQEKNITRKDVFAFSLKKDSTVNEESGKTTYLLLSLNKKVKLLEFAKPDMCIHKGKMLPETLAKYKKAKREYIESFYKKRGKR